MPLECIVVIKAVSKLSKIWWPIHKFALYYKQKVFIQPRLNLAQILHICPYSSISFLKLAIISNVNYSYLKNSLLGYLRVFSKNYYIYFWLFIISSNLNAGVHGLYDTAYIYPKTSFITNSFTNINAINKAVESFPPLYATTIFNEIYFFSFISNNSVTIDNING